MKRSIIGHSGQVFLMLVIISAQSRATEHQRPMGPLHLGKGYLSPVSAAEEVEIPPPFPVFNHVPMHLEAYSDICDTVYHRVMPPKFPQPPPPGGFLPLVPAAGVYPSLVPHPPPIGSIIMPSVGMPGIGGMGMLGPPRPSITLPVPVEPPLPPAIPRPRPVQSHPSPPAFPMPMSRSVQFMPVPMPQMMPYLSPMMPFEPPIVVSSDMVAPDGGINIMPFTDVYTDLMKKHKSKMTAHEIKRFVKKYEKLMLKKL